VLHLTPEVLHWIDLFHTCFTIRGQHGCAWFERVALPRGGGTGEQNAKDMQALDVIEGTANEVLQEHLARIREERERHERPVH
jgi:hypothetical protein